MNSSAQMLTQPVLELLDIAGAMLERHETRDISAPGLLELTGISQHGMATASGLNDYDYQNLSSLSLGHKQLNQVQTVNKIPIPTEILEHFKHIKCHCMMGLFPDIGRAWLTIDSEIYIWTYEQARDVAYYDGLSHLIVSVGLIKPKPGVFINDVKYLLVLTTPIEVIVLGVTFGDTTKTISSPVRSMQSTATFEEMQLMNKPIFILSTDNVAINVVQGSDNGRIFLGGRDGCLYEISYQAESSWFGKRCKKLNHSQGIVSYMVPSFLKVFSENDPIVRIAIDNSRQLLYVLTEKGSIEAWDMGNDCNSMRRLSKVTQNEIVQSASNIIKTIDPSVLKTIKSICPLSKEDSPNLHLLAVTQCGVRFFFATTPLRTNQQIYNQAQQQQMPMQSPMSSQQACAGAASPTGSPGNLNSSAGVQIQQALECQKPYGLFLLHVRLPPGYTPNTTINKPKQVHSAHYSEGTLLLVSTPQQDQDILWSVSSAPFPGRPYLAESATVLPLDGIVWSLAEVRDRCKAKLHSLLRKAQKPKKVVLLTNQGAHIVALLKPVDILQQLLMACHGPHHEAVKAFFQAQTEREACATCLLLACSEQYRGTDLAMWASQAFMLYGGEPSFQHQMLNAAAGVGAGMQSRHLLNSSMTMTGPGLDRNCNSPQMYMSTPMPPSPYASPLARPMPTTPLQGSMQQSQFPLSPIGNQSSYGLNDAAGILYSAKHDGLYLYVARLLRPIWKMRCIDANLCSSLTQADCTLILEDLYAIKAFLDANSVNELSCTVRSYSNQATISNGFSHMLQNSNIPLSDQRNASEQAQAEEKRSLTSLNFFIKHTCEVIALWKILCEHQFQILASQLSKEQQVLLASCSFRDLTLSRYDSCGVLILALINSYLKDNASVSSISAKLRDVCPNLYRHEDAVTFKATEILMNSKSCAQVDEKNEKLRTALQLCKDAAPNLPLQNICQQFTLAGFYEGVVELAATCAAKIDPEEFGIHYYKSDEPAEDREGYTGYASRMNCYKEVRIMLDHIFQTVCHNSTNQEFDFGRQNIANANNEINPNIKIMNIITLSVHIKDPLLHVCVYEWLMAHDMLSELLGLAEPTLGEFLRRNVVRHPENLKLIDLLWKYYEKNGHHSEAARILDNLATTPNGAIPLEQRIEYLARAVMCMRNDSVGYSVSNGILLKELEDKLEIARVQNSVLDAISECAASDREAAKAVNDLNTALYDITDLYQKFADPYDLWECKLTILNCSHHNDPLLIESVWGNIINKAVDCNGTVNERSTRLFAKIESLVKEFGESGHCFPLAFLIRELELKACQLRLPEGIVPEKLVAMNLDIELLMEYYSRMISMNERIWANEGNEWHLVQSSIRVVTLLSNNANSIWHRSKRRIVGKAQDIVSVCLNLCYQKPGTERLQQALKELQSRLQRNLA